MSTIASSMMINELMKITFYFVFTGSTACLTPIQMCVLSGNTSSSQCRSQTAKSVGFFCTSSQEKHAPCPP